MHTENSGNCTLHPWRDGYSRQRPTLQKVSKDSYTLLHPMTSSCKSMNSSCFVDLKSTCMHCKMVHVLPFSKRSTDLSTIVPAHMESLCARVDSYALRTCE